MNDTKGRGGAYPNLSGCAAKNRCAFLRTCGGTLREGRPRRWVKSVCVPPHPDVRVWPPIAEKPIRRINTTDGSRWYIQVQPTAGTERPLESRQRELADCSDAALLLQEMGDVRKIHRARSMEISMGRRFFLRPHLNDPPTAVGGITWCSGEWGCRLKLNNPLTAVRGI